ncbi:hypothetical protein LIER_03212 [Lithospermum erythrorhizon]|uniref:Uncharacterized protein n=1 Tax=Lithospermum erythrorhizon TaxID=34254 RepID=A0AAV3NSB2_LITER
MECGKMQSVVRKAKKKHVKDELDRIKQAEKKKRRLEKALATSAAIRAELEKKKQKKIEEQQRLDEVGAAIAEAVALHVLNDDSDDICNGMLKSNYGLKPWEYGNGFDFVTSGKQPMIPEQNISRCSLEGLRLDSDVYRYGCKWGDPESSGWMVSSEPLTRDPCWQYHEEGCLESSGISAGLIAAQAVSSLRIGERAPLEAYAFNRMMRG